MILDLCTEYSPLYDLRPALNATERLAQVIGLRSLQTQSTRTFPPDADLLLFLTLTYRPCFPLDFGQFTLYIFISSFSQALSCLHSFSLKMRITLIISALVALVAASPAPSPQGMDFSVIDATPPPAETAPPAGAPDVATPYGSASASAIAVAVIKNNPLSARKRKRGFNDVCAPQPSSASPPPGDNSSPSSFTSDPQFASLASNAPVLTGYDVSFTNLQASTQQDGFLRIQTLDSYDPKACQALCDGTAKCVAFNLYVERDPSLNPASNCSNPLPVTNVKCTLYGLPISAATATNSGQYRQQFQVVIAASNGYNKDTGPGPIPVYNGPTPLPCAINASLAQDGTDTYIGSTSFSRAFSPNMCADACTAQTQ
jgi:hypothetical protein